MLEESNKIKDTIEAATAFSKAVPIYDDAIKPIVKPLAKTVGGGISIINASLCHIGDKVWGYEKIREFLEPALADKLSKVPTDRIKEPNAHVVAPAIESFRFLGNEPELREMFANLIANAMDEETAGNAHPSFVEIIKQMSSNEAKIMQLFSKKESQPVIDIRKYNKSKSDLFPVYNKISYIGRNANCESKNTVVYLDNLCRLGLLAPYLKFSNNDVYTEMFSDEKFIKITKEIKQEGFIPDYKLFSLKVTDLGHQFISACVIDKKDQR